jgi:protein O-GlcNAcase/histone acetyltransferase
MPDPSQHAFLAGVIEGFYGPPWTSAEREELLVGMARWGLNAYLYAPKDDLKHRAAWREPYAPEETAALASLIGGCRERGIRFVYALSPGLDMRYGDPGEHQRISARFEQVLALGCDDFALLFDDIPDRMREEDRRRWPTFAAAQCFAANQAFAWVRARRPAARFLFCPTPYCGRMAARGFGGADYLDVTGRDLSPEIDVFWTGPEIIAREISASHLRELRTRLRRPPVIWDNLHANDYDGRRFYCGPYAGRPPELRSEASGILCNPNTEFPLNFVPLRTFAAYLQADASWDPRGAYRQAIVEWLPRFATLGGDASAEELTLLGDCFYLPYEEGAEAESLCRALERLLARPPAAWVDDDVAAFLEPAQRLRDFCARLADLRDRRLFAALHRRTWELREELDLLLGYVRAQRRDPQTPFRSDFHQPGTYRGGMAVRLQRALALSSDGVFRPSIGGAANP